jgi:adenylyl-sulfate kinase
MDGALAPETGFAVWITGLKGSGKGTIARLLAAELARRGLPTELLAGSEFRQNISQGLGFSREDRMANVRRIGYVAKLLTRNGVAVVASAVSPHAAVREECRRMIGRFVEVYAECPVEVCESRDRDGLYSRARMGLLDDFTGITEEYEPPASPEVVVHTDRETPEESTQKILGVLEQLGYVPPVRRTVAPDEALVRATLKALHDR